MLLVRPQARSSVECGENAKFPEGNVVPAAH
jgi:hypothetical protein